MFLRVSSEHPDPPAPSRLHPTPPRRTVVRRSKAPSRTAASVVSTHRVRYSFRSVGGKVIPLSAVRTVVGDTKEGREEKDRNAEERQLERDIEGELEDEEAAEKRGDEHEREQTEEGLAGNE